MVRAVERQQVEEQQVRLVPLEDVYCRVGPHLVAPGLEELTVTDARIDSEWPVTDRSIGRRPHFTVDGKDFTAPLLNPEASLKVGWRIR